MGTTNTSRSRKQSYGSRLDDGGSEESDSDYGFDSQWSTSRSWIWNILQMGLEKNRINVYDKMYSSPSLYIILVAN